MDPVQEQLDGFNSRDVDRFVAAYAPDAIIEDGAGRVLMHGHDAIRAMYGQLFAQSPALHCDVASRIQVGDWVIDEEQTTGFNFPGFPAEIHAAVIYRLADGKIAQVRMLM